MEHKNWHVEELTIDASKANRKVLYMILPISCILVIPFVIIWQDSITLDAFRKFAANNKSGFFGIARATGVIIGGIILHELIHGITWAVFAKRHFRSISFGVLWKELTPYCHCSEPLLIRQYIIGAIMPAVVLGILPTLISYIIGNVWLLAFGVFFTVAAGGDFMIINMLLKEKAEDFVQDHPTKIGCFLYRKRESPVTEGTTRSL